MKASTPTTRIAIANTLHLVATLVLTTIPKTPIVSESTAPETKTDCETMATPPKETDTTIETGEIATVETVIETLLRGEVVIA